MNFFQNLKKNSFLYEAPIFYGLLVFLNHFLIPGNPGFLEVDPHPYWLGILLFAFRYQLAGGLLAGLLSTTLYLFYTWTSLNHYLFEDFSFYLLPISFTLIGTLMGWSVRQYQKRIQKNQVDSSTLVRKLTSVKEELELQKEITRGLEKNIATRMSTLMTLYEGARRLESKDREELFLAILEFTMKTLEADEASLYLKVSDGWKLKYHRSSENNATTRPEFLKPNEGLTGLAGSSKKIVSIRDFLGDLEKIKILQSVGDALMAGPLKLGESEDAPVVGVLSIQALPFLKFNSASVSLFSFLLRWASRALGNTEYIQELRSKKILDPEFNLYTSNYFISRAEQEFQRSKTYYLPLSLGLIHIQGLEKIPQHKKYILLKTVSELLKETSREMDVIARSEDPEIPFSILWSTTSKSQAMELSEKFLMHFEKIKSKDSSIKLHVGISDFNPHTKNLEQLFLEAKKSLQHVS